MPPKRGRGQGQQDRGGRGGRGGPGGRGVIRGGRGRGFPAGAGFRGRGARGSPFQARDMNQVGFQYQDDANATQAQINTFVQTSIAAAATSRSLFPSGSSTPRRGYPPRAPRVPVAPVAVTSTVAAHHGGLGYHSLTSMEAAADTTPQSYGYDRSGRGSGRGRSGFSDARLLKPMVFVKSKGLTGLEKKEADTPVVDKGKGKEKPEEKVEIPLAEVSSAPLADKQRHQPAPSRFSGFPPPPEFATMPEVIAPMTLDPAPQPTDPILPDIQKPDITQPENPALALLKLLTSTSEPGAQTHVALPELAMEMSSTPKVEAVSMAMVEATLVSGTPEAPLNTSTEVPELGFMVDTIGDPTLAASTRNSVPWTSTVKPLGAAHSASSSESDEDEDEILYQPPPSAGPSNSKNFQALPTTSYARTIEDPVFTSAIPGPSSIQFDIPPPSGSSSSSSDDQPRHDSRISKSNLNASPRANKKALKAAARRRKAERKRRTRVENQGRTFGFRYASMGTGHPRDQTGEFDLEPREDDSDLDWGEEGPPVVKEKDGESVEVKHGKMRARSRKEQDEMAILADYMENTAMDRNEDEEDDDMEGDETALRAFVSGMGQGGQHHTTIDDLRDELKTRLDEEEAKQGGWKTESESSGSELDGMRMDGDGGDGESEGEGEEGPSIEIEIAVDALVGVEEGGLLGEDSDEVEGMFGGDDSSGDEDDEEVAASLGVRGLGYSTPGAGKGKGKGKALMLEQSEESEDDDVDGLFDGRYKWDDDGEDEDMDDVERALYGGNKPQRLRQKAIEMGDFSIYEYDDNDGAMATKRTRDKKGPAGGSGDHFADKLQAQWEKDRKTKGVYKRNRALARLEADPKSKKERKKEARRQAGGGGGTPSKDDLPALNKIIREFIVNNPDSASLPLAPMPKRERMAIHLLAETYGLKSKSMGKGSNRFPVLERTTRTSVFGADARKVAAIIGVTEPGGSLPGGRKGQQNGKFAGLWREFAGVSKGAASKNREGSVVGHGANEIGANNVGFKLLAKMGWSEGSAIGVSGGLQAPIAAVVKTSKGGLGMLAGGYVSRR